MVSAEHGYVMYITVNLVINRPKIQDIWFLIYLLHSLKQHNKFFLDNDSEINSV